MVQGSGLKKEPKDQCPDPSFTQTGFLQSSEKLIKSPDGTTVEPPEKDLVIRIIILHRNAQAPPDKFFQQHIVRAVAAHFIVHFLIITFVEALCSLAPVDTQPKPGWQRSVKIYLRKQIDFLMRDEVIVSVPKSFKALRGSRAGQRIFSTKTLTFWLNCCNL